MAVSTAFRYGGAGQIIVTGLDVVTEAFLSASVEVPAKAVSATRDAAQDIAAAQRSEVPVRSGRTRESVSHEVEAGPDGVVASIGPSYFVARFLQFGTVKMSPKMDLFAASQPGVDSWLSKMEQIAGDV